jgi:hypothetical protein
MMSNVRCDKRRAYEGRGPTGKPVRERHREQFLARIDVELTGDEAWPAASSEPSAA